MSTRTIERRLDLIEQKLQPRKRRHPICFLRDGMTLERFKKENDVQPGDIVHVARFISGKK